MATLKKSSKRKSPKKRQKLVVRKKRNPIKSSALIKLKDKIVDTSGNVYEVIKHVNSAQVFAKNIQTNSISIIDVKNVDFYDPKKIKTSAIRSPIKPIIPQSPVSMLMEQHAASFAPVYVEFWNWVYPLNATSKFEIMIFHKLNSERKPVSKYHYAIDLESTRTGEQLMSITSEKIENFTGYDDLETAIKGVRAIVRVKFDIILPKDLKLTEHKTVFLEKR